MARRPKQTEIPMDRMTELSITIHKFSDQIATIKPGKSHVKIKTVKADTEEGEE